MHPAFIINVNFLYAENNSSFVNKSYRIIEILVIFKGFKFEIILLLELFAYGIISRKYPSTHMSIVKIKKFEINVP